MYVYIFICIKTMLAWATRNSKKYNARIFYIDPGIHQYITARKIKLLGLLNKINLTIMTENIREKIKI